MSSLHSLLHLWSLVKGMGRRHLSTKEKIKSPLALRPHHPCLQSWRKEKHASQDSMDESMKRLKGTWGPNRFFHPMSWLAVSFTTQEINSLIRWCSFLRTPGNQGFCNLLWRQWVVALAVRAWSLSLYVFSYLYSSFTFLKSRVRRRHRTETG